MKRFKFRLEKVLDLRVLKERKAMGVLGQAIVRRGEAERERERFEKRAEDAKTMLQNCLTEQELPLQMIELHHREMERLSAGLEVASLRITEAEIMVSEAREEVRKCQGQRRALEKLRERDRRQFDEAALRAESLEMDEIAAGRHVRREEATPAS